jgi:hypothetical protein
MLVSLTFRYSLLSTLQRLNSIFGCANCSNAFNRRWFSELPILKHLVYTNDAPAEHDAAKIRHTITEGAKDLEYMENASTHLTQVLQRLTTSREALAAQLSECRRVVNPVRKLPAEILAEIFLYATGATEGQAMTDELSKPGSPMQLMGVCRRWRETAMSLQDLWTCIDIKLGFRDSERSLANLVGLVGLHLKRSKNASLHINLTSRNDANVRPFIDALLPHSSRWQFARIAIPAASFQTLIGIKGSLDRLARLDLSVTDSHSPDPAVFEMFEFAPQLSNLKLSTFVSGRQSIPWSQLTRLELSLSVSQCLLVLSLAPDIVECRLSCEHKTFDNLNTPTPVNLAHLRALHIDGFFGSSISVLSFLTTPALESFSLNVLSLQLLDKDTMETTDLVDTLLPFISRSSNTLRDLTLYGSNLEAEVFISLLQETPNLRHLSLDDHCGLITSDVVQPQLKYDPNSPTYLIPLLETMKVSVVPNHRFEQFNCNVFVDMIESRWRISGEESKSQIRVVTLADRKASRSIGAHTRLEDFQREGLQLSLV